MFCYQVSFDSLLVREQKLHIQKEFKFEMFGILPEYLASGVAPEFALVEL